MALPLIYRVTKGSPLTFTEGDDNLRILESASLQSLTLDTASGALTAGRPNGPGGAINVNLSGLVVNTASYATQALTASFADAIKTANNLGVSVNNTIDGVSITSSLRSVNGSFPDANGNAATALAAVYTGDSASFTVSSSNPAFTGSITNGSVWVIANDTSSAFSGSNGEAYIYQSSSVGQWFQLGSTNLAQYDARYLMLAGTNSPMQGDVNFGANRITNLGPAQVSTDAVNLGQITASLLSYVLTSSFNFWTGSNASYFFGTSSNADTASFIETAQTASYVTLAQSASYVDITGSGVLVNYGPTGQIQLTGSAALAVSFSFQDVTTVGAVSTASIVATGSFKGNLTGTASWAINAQTASYVVNALTASYFLTSSVSTASYVENAQTASYVEVAQTASFVATASTAISASHALTSVTASNADSVKIGLSLGVYVNNFDGLSVTASVRTVNGSFPVNGNVATALTSVITGDSASFVSQSVGEGTSSFTEGTVWVIAGSTGADSGSNGLSYIYQSGSVGQWFELGTTTLAQNDARYLQLAGTNSPMQGNVNFGAFKIQNLAPGTISSDAINLGQLTSSLEAYTLTSSFNSWTGSNTSVFAGTSSYVDIVGSGITVNYNGSQIQLTGSSGGGVTVSDTAPVAPLPGDLWYDSSTTTLNVYYSDGTSAQWVEVGPGASSSPVTVSTTAPTTPTNGNLWYNSDNTTLFIYYNDGTSAQWVSANNLALATAVSASYALTSSFAQTAATASVTITNILTSSSFANTASLAESLNTSWTRPLNNTAGGVSNWTTLYAGTGKNTLITATVTAFRNPNGSVGTINLLRDGVIVASASKFANTTNQDTWPTLMYLVPNETGNHIYSISLGTGMGADSNSFCTMTIQTF
jgi:hypothetical protein